MALDIAQIVAVGVVVTVLAIMLKGMAPEFALAVSIAGSIVIFFMTLPKLAVVIELLRDMSAKVDVNMAYVYIVLRIVGIAYIAEFGAQICADAGESAIASKIEIGGKILIMFVSAPVLLSVVDLILKMLP